MASWEQGSKAKFFTFESGHALSPQLKMLSCLHRSLLHQKNEELDKAVKEAEQAKEEAQGQAEAAEQTWSEHQAAQRRKTKELVLEADVGGGRRPPPR